MDFKGLEKIRKSAGVWAAVEALLKTKKIDKLETLKHWLDEKSVDRDSRMLSGIDKQIDDIILFLQRDDKKDKEIDLANKLVKELPNLRRTKKELRGIIGHVAEDEEDPTSDIELSVLDKFNQNK